MRKHLNAALLAVCAVLIVPAFAAAHPVKRDFNATFPHASALCVNVAAGETPKRLAGSVDKIKAACDTLHTSFEEARTMLVPLVRLDRDPVFQKRSRLGCRPAFSHPVRPPHVRE